MSGPSLPRRLTAEALGTGLLVAAVVGSGIMGERLANGNEAIALLANTAATAAALYVLITVFAPISGAQFNPVVTLVFAARRALPVPEAALYVAVQAAGAMAGAALAHLMFDLPLFTASTKPRAGLPLLLSEVVATFGLVGAILALVERSPARLPGIVAAYIAAAYWFTASTSFANPAVTLARAFTDSFSGVRPMDAPGFVAAQLAGAALAAGVFGWLLRRPADVSGQVDEQEVGQMPVVAGQEAQGLPRLDPQR